MQVSVIIPVYNAEKFVERAVRSALQQSETGEVLVIDDGSTDRSIEIIHELSSQDQRVRFFQHPDKNNHGPGVTRNIGLQHASCEFITFLDADDWYVPGRFHKAGLVFARNHHSDGVYEKVVRVQQELDLETGESNQKFVYSYGSDSPISSRNLFQSLVTSDTAIVSLDGLTLKKDAIRKIGFFDPTLHQAEDTDYIWRLGADCVLLPGEQEKTICFSELHGSNVTLKNEEVLLMKYKLYQKWMKKMMLNDWSKRVNRNFVNHFLYYHPLMKHFRDLGFFRISLKGVMLFVLFIRYPVLLKKLI